MSPFSDLRQHFKGASSPQEKRLVLKLDFFILTFCCLAYFMYFESCIFAGTQYILGSWYTKKELGQRTGLFTASGLAGGMFGGFLQTAIYSSMNGLHGMPGWKWLFIVNTPSTTTAFYLSEDEIKLARERVPIREEGEKILTWSFISRILHSWYFYGFCFLWILGNTSESQSNQSLLNLYMQSHPTEHYTVFQRNNYPTGVQAVGVVSTLLWATSTDVWGRRWLSGYYVAFTAIANAAIILAPTSTAAKFGAYYWAGSIYCIQATFFAWANDSMRNESPALRACVIACMNAAGNCFQAWWPLIFFRADDAPEFRKGMIAMISVGAAMMIWVIVLIFMDRRLSKTQIQVIEAVDADGHVEAGLSAVKNVDSRDKGSTDK
ncbi:pantothenate transporter liz1 [Colletotrichum kahawae]|uniref:Pantothenate transporter liz1 n=1 Tax=Colletotrichum kahawae TaxID=34407 RepID=A0AAD9YSF3_COLKA|nr:pantothenate transporter liz1 [Colletotrichum kahawae]